MEKILELKGCKVKVEFEDGIIRVYGNAELWRFIGEDVKARLELLAETIKIEYEYIFAKTLNITTNSLIVEILVHVYCDYLGLGFNKYIAIKFTQNLVNKLLKRAEVVDCGERQKDSNRWVWDGLVPFKNALLKLFPRNLYQSNLKTR